MFPDHQLPSDLMTSADRPEDIVSRPCTPEDPEFVKLRKLKNQYGFRVIVAPTAVRENSLAEAVEIDSWEHADITVAGPYYWRLPSKYFADFKHLNRAGTIEMLEVSEVFTRETPIIRPSNRDICVFPRIDFHCLCE